MTSYLYEFTINIYEGDLQRLFAQTEWAANRSQEAIRVLLANTPVCLCVWDGARLIGFGRAVTDDVFRALIEDVVVDEAYRGKGIGGEIIRRLLERLDHVEEIVLNCTDALIPFYETLGFQRTGMTYMNIWKGEKDAKDAGSE
ncbi:MAG: GNAT family N-acetyltransferase [Chloroflexi bacterium]|nr:GNAT family N-acetyltransferase [Chloroflexota bacterium]